VIQVHEIIGTEMSMELISHAFPILEGHFDSETRAPVPALIWEDTPEFQSLARNLEYLTGRRGVLGPFSAEVLHVTGYSFGSSDSVNDVPSVSQYMYCLILRIRKC